MRTINIKYHVVTNATEKLPFPVEELKSLYATSGIVLNLVEGDPISSDPAHRRIGTYPSFVELYRKSGPDYGHLIIGLDDPNKDKSVNGELLDRESRGVAAVYTYSDDIAIIGESAFLQTCAHEIGHMLNLAHHDVSKYYTSVMDKALNRGQDISLSWSNAEAEARNLDAAGQQSFFTKPPTLPRCYPFAFAARDHLNNDSPDHLLPWQSKFENPYEGSQDKWYHDKSLRLEPENKRHIVGGTLAFIIRFRNNGTRSRSIPARIGTVFDTLLLTVTRPDGTRYRHLSRTLACSRRRRILKPGEEIIRPFCTVRGPGGAVFPKPGRYLVSAVFPQGQAAAMPIEINVEPRDDGPLANPQFRRFIAYGAPHRSPRLLRLLDEALAADVHLDSASRGYLALIRTNTERDPSRSAALHKIALADTSPAAVRHAAVIEQVKTLARDGALDKSSWASVKKRHLRREEDQYLIEQLEEFQSW